MPETKSKPKSSNSASQKELDKVQEQFDAFDSNVKEMTLDRMNKAPKQESVPQTQLSSKDIEKSKDIYLKPERSIGPGVHPKTGEREKFNEQFRTDYNFAMEYVQFVAENKEIIGEAIEMWTKPFPGTNLEFWRVPTNKPIWGPRHLAEQIKRCSYHRLKMDQTITTGSGHEGQYYGHMAVDTIVNRLDAHPISSKKSLFMGAKSF